MDVVLYARVSTKRQAEKDTSIPEQIRRMTDYCKEKGHTIIGTYKDEGSSARSDRRPVFQNMILDVTSARVKAQAVIIFNRSRYFRNVYGAKKYEERILARKGIEIISLDIPTEGMDPPVKHFTTTIIDAASQYQSEFNGAVTLGGMLGNARQGYYNGGKPPYGYRRISVLNDKGKPKSKLAICATEKELVDRIFSLYIRGLGSKRIAITLNQESLPARNGKKWEKGKILDIVANPIHKGEYIYNRRTSRTKRENPEKEWVRIKVDPTVNEETFNLAQEIRKKNAPQVTNPAVVSSPMLLTGILKCGLCGGSMSLETGKSGRYRYYNCRNFLRKKSCPGQRVAIDLLDKEVLEHIARKFFNVKRLTLLLQEFSKEMKGDKRSRKAETTAIRSEMRNKERKLENIYRAIEEGIITKGNINQRIEVLQSEIKTLQSKLGEVVKTRKFTLPAYVFSPIFLQRFQSKLTEVFNSDISLAKSYLKLFLAKIKLTGRNVTLVAKKDILLRALITNNQPYLTEVPTAGVEWLPGQDSNLQPSGYKLPDISIGPGLSLRPASRMSGAMGLIGGILIP